MYVYIIPMFFMNINISNTVVWLFQGTKYLYGSRNIYMVLQNPSTTASFVRDHSSENPLAPAPYFNVDVDMAK